MKSNQLYFNIAILIGLAIMIIKSGSDGTMIGPGDITNVIGGQNTSTNTTTNIMADTDTLDVGAYFTDNFPAYIDNRSNNCEWAGGDWISNDDVIGCYGIPIWDSSLCSSAEIIFMRATCLNIEGVYTCNAHEISCEVNG